MKSHPAIPDHDDLDGVFQKIRQIVEQHIDQPAAKNDPDNTGVDHGIERRMPHRILWAARQPFQQPPAQQDTRQIGQRIPPHRQRAKADRHRINRRKGQGSQGRGQLNRVHESSGLWLLRIIPPSPGR